tara:strand:+ start:868 stop:1080 length:213 start_codon:yes stop_codon:yes gene_type:complete
MDTYKQNWAGEGEWKYQNAELEERYAAFVVQKQEQDQVHQEAKREYLEKKNEFDAERKANGDDVEMTGIN